MKSGTPSQSPSSHTVVSPEDLRAVEQLRLVFAELHAVTIRDTVSFHFAWEQFDADGEPVQGEIVEEAMTILLDRLLWWAKALLKAREAEPYMQERA